MAVLTKEEYREFTFRVAELSEQGYDLPHTVETLEDGKFKVVLHGDHNFEELDKLSNSEYVS